MSLNWKTDTQRYILKPAHMTIKTHAQKVGFHRHHVDPQKPDPWLDPSARPSGTGRGSCDSLLGDGSQRSGCGRGIAGAWRGTVRELSGAMKTFSSLSWVVFTQQCGYVKIPSGCTLQIHAPDCYPSVKVNRDT